MTRFNIHDLTPFVCCQAPVRFDTAESTTPALQIHLTTEDDGFVLEVHYGDRRTQKAFRE